MGKARLTTLVELRRSLYALMSQKVFPFQIQRMVSHLISKYGEYQDPPYIFKVIPTQTLLEIRAEDHRTVFKTIDGSSSFQVAVFRPNETSFWAAPYLCVCKDCKIKYGSCSVFTEYFPVVEQLSKTSLCSEVVPTEAVQ